MRAGGDVVVTGTGMVSALGDDVASTWAGLLAGRTAVRRWDDLAAEGHLLDVAARVSGDAWRDDADEPDGREPDPTRRGRDLAVAAARQAWRDAGLEGSGLEERTGVWVGTTMGESAVFETARERGRFDLAQGGGFVFAGEVGDRLGLRGPRRTMGAACAAGNYAIGAAARAVASGRVDVAIAGGVEPFSRIAMTGFARMRAMAPEGCTPFGAVRRGMTLGEGAAFVVLRRSADAERVRARVGALGLSADAHHPTAPREDGVMMAAAMRAGLQRSGVSPSEVGWVSAHGTGTPRSDAAEALALRQVFGDDVPPVSSVKGALGHSLGAATAVEAVLAVRALETGVLPPNVGTTDVDGALGIDVVTAPRRAAPGWVLSCGFAFGGLNSALLLGHRDAA